MSKRRATPQQIELIRQVCDLIQQNIENPPTLEIIGERVHMSPYHLQRTFKRVMGITPRQYADAKRLTLLKHELRHNDTVTDALYAAGYGSSSRVYEDTHGKMGMTPAEYRNGGADMDISYILTDSPLGRLLVARTDRGLCAVYLGDDDGELVTMLNKEYPQAHITHGQDEIDTWIVTIIEHMNGWQQALDLPLDLQATAFQRRVWQELRNIPYGETRTYSDIANAIGNPKAVRAVASACARNPVAMVNPCHRVVRSDGTMGGYRWGVERKEDLLETEQQENG